MMPPLSPVSEELPQIGRNTLVGSVGLLGREIPVFIEAPGKLNSPVLYQWAAEVDRLLVGVYFGLAKRGIGRPIQEYQPQLEKLRRNRHVGSRMSNGAPGHPYDTNFPWSFRWVHHELERLLADPAVFVTLAIRFQSCDQAAENGELGTAERALFTPWLSDDRCWNDVTMTSAVSKGRKLDQCWI